MDFGSLSDSEETEQSDKAEAQAAAKRKRIEKGDKWHAIYRSDYEGGRAQICCARIQHTTRSFWQKILVI